MKTLIFLVILSLVIIMVSCSKTDEQELTDIDENAYFLSGIRPNYFKKLNFDSKQVRNEIPQYLTIFKATFDKAEINYNNNLIRSPGDLENYRLLMQYYSFYLTALVSNYMDQNLSFSEINGDRKAGLFSNSNQGSLDFERIEMREMITTALNIATKAYTINGYNDRAYGFYVLVNQIEKRFQKGDNANDPIAHKLATDFVSYNLQDLTLVPVWNLLMPMVVFTNYNDPLNTFNNKEMDNIFKAYEVRLVVPGTLPDIGGKYPEILGPLYKFDVNLKKIEWTLRNHTGSWQAEDLEKLDGNLQTMAMITNYIELQKSHLLNSWPYKSSYQQRQVMLNELSIYRNNITSYPKPELKEGINSGLFKKAYQCYSCHADSKIN